MVKHIGQVTVADNTLHVPQSMKSDGVERFISSKRFQKIKGDGRELLKEGRMKILKSILFAKLPDGDRGWMCRAGTNPKNLPWQMCVKVGKKARVIETSETFTPFKDSTVMVEEFVNYSFIIKTSPETAANMATKKKAAKKAAPKKAAAAKGEKKGPGKIEQIIALHKAGKSNAEIVEKGFNKTTVSIQVSKYKKGGKK